MFRTLTGLFEPSAIVQLPDGRFLVLEDEEKRPFSLVAIDSDGNVDSHPLSQGLFDFNDTFWKVGDLEGVTVDQTGMVYAVTSHSRDGDGREKKSRGKLVRFRIDGNRVVAPEVVVGLRAALAAKHPVLSAAARIEDVKAAGGLNIEALEFSPDQQRLFIGFRSPLLDGCALIASVDDPAASFGTGAPLRISDSLTTLDLAGNGIRGMSYVPSLGGFLVVGGPVGTASLGFNLWYWSGDRNQPVRRITVPGLPGFGKAEGVCPATIDGRERIVIVSDDGSRQEQRFARFLLLDPAQLLIAPP